MKLADQVCTHAQANALWALGLSVTPAQFYFHPANPYHPEGPHVQQSTTTIPYESRYAYGAAELGEMLPATVYYAGNPDSSSYDLVVTKNDQGGGWYATYEQRDVPGLGGRFEGKMVYEETQAQAMASLLIWLLENDHHTVTEAHNALLA